MATARVALIDDEPNLVKFVSHNLRARGYDVASADNGLEGTELVRSYKPDLVILDVNMPGMDGFEACSYIRQFSHAAIIMLTANGSEGDKIRALDMGADDYLTKPFGIGELMARVRALMRRVSGDDAPDSRPEALQLGDLTIDFEHRRVLVAGNQVRLTPTEYSLLEQLATHEDRVMTHRQLLSSVWGAEYREEAEYLRVYVGRLRHKLESDPSNPRYILTEPGVGYRFAANAGAPV